MEVIFEGALSRSWSMKDVLESVLRTQDKRYGILRIASPHSGLSGRLAVCDGTFIVGAVIAEDGQTGYNAVRRLLSVRDGNFAYLDAGSHAPDFSDSLCLSMEKIVLHLPDLPEEPGDLFDQKSLLDRVFGGTDSPFGGEKLEIDASQLPEKVIPPVAPVTVQAAGSGLPSSKAAWNFMQPLLENGNRVYAPEEGPPEQFDDTSAHKISLNKLRGQKSGGAPWYRQLLRDAFLSKQALLWITVCFIVCLAAALYFNDYLKGIHSPNHGSSITIQKGTGHSPQQASEGDQESNVDDKH